MELHTIKELIASEDFETLDLHELLNKNAFEVKNFTQVEFPKEDHVWDEDKSVKWNREKTQQEIERIKSQQQAVKDNEIEILLLEERAIINAFSNTYGITKEKTKIAYNYAYDKGHSSGTSEILNHLYDVVDLYVNMSKK